MRKIIYGIISLFVLFFIFSEEALAQSILARGTPSVYKVTLKQFQLSADGGTTWITIGTGDMEFDIASVNAGAKAGDYVSGSALPEGTYNKSLSTISATFKMRGYVYYSGTNRTYYTTSTGIQYVSGNVSDTSQMTNYDEQTITIPGYSQGEALSTTDVPPEDENIVIIKGVSYKVRISFDVTNTLCLYDDYQFYPGPPTVTAVEIP